MKTPEQTVLDKISFLANQVVLDILMEKEGCVERSRNRLKEALKLLEES